MDEDNVLFVGFTGDEAVPGANGANWTAADFDSFERSIESLGNRLVERVQAAGGSGGNGGSGDYGSSDAGSGADGGHGGASEAWNIGPARMAAAAVVVLGASMLLL
jgi:hypothetical protein